MEDKLNMHDRVKRAALIVDDEQVNREILGAILSQEYEVMYAENGKEAIQLVKENKNILSVILLDLIMPGLDGFDVMNVLRCDDTLKDIPVIVLTSEKEAELKSLELGAADFITKPYDMPEVIIARVNRIVDLAMGNQIIQSTEKDGLTGLFTKSFFYEYSQLMDRFNPGRKMDVISLNIQSFHLVNELYGRIYGDKVLVCIAQQIFEYLKDTEGIATRTEADAFYIYVKREPSYKKLVQMIETGVKELDKKIHLRYRFGIYDADEPDADIEAKCDRARLAGNKIKKDLSENIVYYDRKLREESLYKQRLMNDMHEGLEKKEFEVFYQPKYDITGDEPVIKNAEALVRWNHPKLGMIRPADFVPVFEENGLIQEVDHFVWRETAATIRELREEHGISLSISVNVSRTDIYSDDFDKDMTALVQEFGLTPEDMHLEITESAYSQNQEQLVEVVDRLRAQGFKIEMDDFGSGYSSLHSLSTLPIDVLKMDMKFVRTIHEDRKSLRFIELIMDIADYLGVPVVAEGVEFEEQYQLLKQAGCAVIQGFYFSKPLSKEDLKRLLISK